MLKQSLELLKRSPSKRDFSTGGSSAETPGWYNPFEFFTSRPPVAETLPCVKCQIRLLLTVRLQVPFVSGAERSEGLPGTGLGSVQSFFLSRNFCRKSLCCSPRSYPCPVHTQKPFNTGKLAGLQEWVRAQVALSFG